MVFVLFAERIIKICFRFRFDGCTEAVPDIMPCKIIRLVSPHLFCNIGLIQITVVNIAIGGFVLFCGFNENVAPEDMKPHDLIRHVLGLFSEFYYLEIILIGKVSCGNSPATQGFEIKPLSSFDACFFHQIVNCVMDIVCQDGFSLLFDSMYIIS